MLTDDANTFWKRKLAAFLHDPPSKCLNLGEHEEWSAKAMSAAGLDSTQYPRLPDWEASAADRLPFPKSRPASVSCVFDGQRAGFHHPLGGRANKNGPADPCVLNFEKALSGLDQLEGADSRVQPVLDTSTLGSWSAQDVDRARFFAHWRLWRKWACEMDWRFNFLPADTRLPDHTIWHHMQVTSALAGCAISDDPSIPLRPAFLKLQIGPVQDFIAAARSIRDLWSGSYLLSWLMAAGLKKLSELAGPDAVLFPSLWGQPLFDLHWRDSLWSQVSLSNRPQAKKCWDAIKATDAALLTPNLPNVFLALLPADRAEAWARETEAAIRNEFTKIAASVWNACESAGLCEINGMIDAEARKGRFDQQIAQFLTISWQVTPWPQDLESALNLAPPEPGDPEDRAMPATEARRRIKAVRTMAEESLPKDHRDSRYYHSAGKPEYKITDPARLKSRGLAWSVIVAHNAWQLDGVRQVRPFAGQAGPWKPGAAQNKDSLTGRDEAVASVSEWKERVPPEWRSLFKYDGDWIGAATLVKRLWHLTYLKGQWGLPTGGGEFSMPNLHSLAAGNPFGKDEADEPAAGEKYFAVLAFDGDEIGKWVSGEKTPPIAAQLADYHDGSGRQRQGLREYFERDPRFAEFLKTQRPLSPSYHLQLSEALGNFAIHCAAAVVEGHRGRLIYCGGDDVLALLPADTALECAQDLNRAFTGQKPVLSVQPRMTDGPERRDILAQKSSGFLSTALQSADGDIPIPFTVPGPAASASVGIAIAHFKTPLQDVVRAAQAAEKRAKGKILGRSAVALSLFKRSGEITEWGCQWDSGGLDLYEALARGLAEGKLSTKFPHRICQLLEPYLTSRSSLTHPADAENFDAAEIIGREFAQALSRQSTAGCEGTNREQLTPLLQHYLAQSAHGFDLPIEKPAATAAAAGPGPSGAEPPSMSRNQFLLTSLIGLCTAVAFAHRTQPEDTSNPPQGH